MPRKKAEKKQEKPPEEPPEDEAEEEEAAVEEEEGPRVRLEVDGFGLAFSGDLQVLEALADEPNAPLRQDKWGKTLVHYAAVHQHRSIVEDMLAKKGNINASDLSGQTPLWDCMELNLIDEMGFLQAKGAKVNTINNTGLPLLQAAIINGNSDTVGKCLDLGADLSVLDSQGRNALHWACTGRSLPILELLLGVYGTVNLPDYYGLTPLHRACMWGRTDYVPLLLGKEADPNAMDRYGRTPLHYLAQRGFDDTASALLSFEPVKTQEKKKPPPKKKKGEEVPVEEPAKATDVDREDNDNLTALQVAMAEGHTHMVSLFASHGASVQRNSEQHGTLLHQAVNSRRADLTEVILKGGVDVNALDHNGQPSLYRALYAHDAEITRSLLSNGADPNLPESKDGSSPLHLACGLQNAELVKLMLTEAKATPNSRDHLERTPLHVAARFPDVSIASLVLDHLGPGDIDLVDCNGRSALHVAAECCQPEIVQLLIWRGADTWVRDRQGWGPLHVSVDSGCVSSTNTLLANGCPANELDKAKNTPLFLASKAGKVETARALMGFALNPIAPKPAPPREPTPEPEAPAPEEPQAAAEQSDEEIQEY